MCICRASGQRKSPDPAILNGYRLLTLKTLALPPIHTPFEVYAHDHLVRLRVHLEKI